MSTDRICAWHECSNIVPRKPGEQADHRHYLRRECCSQTCASKLGQQRAQETKARNPNVCPSGRTPSDDGTPWPELTGNVDFHGGFARHNIPLKPGGLFRMLPPDRQSLTGYTAAMAVRSGSE